MSLQIQSRSDHAPPARLRPLAGSFVRRLALPEGVQGDDITASYRDGVLEVRTPVPEKAQQPPARKIEITRG